MAHDLTPTVAYPIPAITVPDDGDDANAASVQNGFQDAADGIATLAARLGGMSTGLTTEWSYPSAKGRSRRLCALGGSVSPVYVPPGGSASAAGAGAWRQHFLNASGAGPGGRDLITPTGKMYTDLTFHQYVKPLETIMNGSTITLVEFRVTCGTTQGTSTNRIVVEFFKTDLLGTRTSIGSTTESSGTTGDKTIDIVVSEVLDLSGHMYYLSVTSSAGAATSPDYILGYNVNSTDPGPRN
jgi:hypothetical protein